MLTGLAERQYERKRSVKRITYDTWIREKEGPGRTGSEKNSSSVEQDSGSMEQDNGSMEQDGGETPGKTLLFYSEAGIPTEKARQITERFFRENPGIVLAYGDEDILDPVDGRRCNPWFKPEWSPDTFCSYFYWGSAVAVRREWMEGILSLVDREVLRIARSEGAKKISDLYRLARELTRIAGGFERSCRTIGHIPQILFHCREEGQQEAFRQFGCPDGRTELQRVSSDVKVSIIIPSKDNPALLEQCIQSVLRTQGQEAYELIVVDNGSSEENRLRSECFLRSLPVKSTYLYRPMPFHFSRMCNLGAQIAVGENLLFLNDDIEMGCPGWMEEMSLKASLPYVGAVGMKLYYPQGRLIQHDGITNLPGGPVHKLQFAPDDQCYDHGRNLFDWNVLAVTGACLMCGAEKFRAVGGFCEGLAVTYNDADLCFGLWELGYSNVVLNRVFAYHHESFSRGMDESSEKLERLRTERKKLYERHPGLLDRDPYFPEGLCRNALDAGIRPAFVTARNTPQLLDVRKEEIFLVQAGAECGKDGRKISAAHRAVRRDDCLQIGIGRCDDCVLEGYAVVCGDNNACYERILVLCPIEERAEGNGRITVYTQKLSEQYRPDLEANISQQKNAELCGFYLEWGNVLPEGVYRIGILARNKLNGLRLLNWSRHVWHNRQDGMPTGRTSADF